MSADSVVSVVVLYPRLLGTYGDSGNATVLCRRAEARGLGSRLLTVDAGEPIPRSADIYVLGGGEDVNQTAAARGIEKDGGLAEAVDNGAVVFAICAGFQILGSPGLGMIDVHTEAMPTRAVGDLVTTPDGAELTDDVLIGFENHRGRTVLGPGVRPLGRVQRGIGNGAGDGADGAVSGRIFGSYLHGPALALNPALADHLLTLAVGPLPAAPTPDDTLVGRLRADRLQRIGRGP
jgi:CobQ-like glutamine amidotransferase family enzyme